LAASLQTLTGVILPSDSIGFKGHTGVEALCGQEEKREGGKELVVFNHVTSQDLLKQYEDSGDPDIADHLNYGK